MSGKQKRSLQSRLFSITSALYTLYSLRAFSLVFNKISIKTEILVLLKLDFCIIQAFIWTNLYIAKLFNLSSIRICLQFLSYLLLKVCNHRVNIPYFIQKLMRNYFFLFKNRMDSRFFKSDNILQQTVGIQYITVRGRTLN